MGTLYLVPTPVGNLEDITLRALRILREVDLIAAEDTRTTGRLLAHFAIDTPQTSYHDHNRRRRIPELIDALVTGDVALVADAGTPSLSDPGVELVAAVAQAGHRVEPLPGPTALIPALVASGLPTDSFLYLGFPPPKEKARRDLLAAVRDLPYTLVFYEAPHRLRDMLADAADILGDRPAAVAREISKLHEEIWRGTLSGALDHFTEPRGEIVLVIGGAEPQVWGEDAVRDALRQRLAAGQARSRAAKAVAAESGWARSDVYDLDV
ncbi:MAG: 16S rRNA (cytidine(1402)-2'-O)-methyltransferase [Chloroflexi bacterium]|nr:16S rRNA (cytidine(1402)-2'-O)-methyltransferase [Chloroflexota bacterium]